MKSIIFCNYINVINGALIDVIEYYLCMLENKINVKLLILNLNPVFQQKLIELIKDRYDLNGLEWKNNIIGINKSYILKTKFYRLLITDYGTINIVRGLLSLKNNKSKIIILSDLYTDKKEFLIDSNLYPTRCVIYYGEMPFVYKDIQYKHKFLFSKFKSLRKEEPNILLHSPKNNDYKFTDNYKNIFKDKKIIIKTDNHKNRFFELFNEFVYYHADTYFDPRPRLMHECSFYNKTIHYLNDFRCEDGSYYRWKDLNDNGLKDRFLNEKDEIIREFI